jgi:hypothetical protein
MVAANIFFLILHYTGSLLNNIPTTFQPGNNYHYTIPSKNTVSNEIIFNIDFN